MWCYTYALEVCVPFVDAIYQYSFFETLTRRVFHDRVYFLFMLIKWDKLHHNYVHVGVHLSLLLRNNGTKSYTSHCFVTVEQYIYISIRLLCWVSTEQPGRGLCSFALPTLPGRSPISPGLWRLIWIIEHKVSTGSNVELITGVTW